MSINKEVRSSPEIKSRSVTREIALRVLANRTTYSDPEKVLDDQHNLVCRKVMSVIAQRVGSEVKKRRSVNNKIDVMSKFHSKVEEEPGWIYVAMPQKTLRDVLQNPSLFEDLVTALKRMYLLSPKVVAKWSEQDINQKILRWSFVEKLPQFSSTSLAQGNSPDFISASLRIFL